MNNNFRYTELLQKLERNPLKAQMARALDVAEIFAGDVEYLSLNKDLSPQGRDNARRSKLRAAVRDNRDARAPINEMKAKLEAKRAAVQRPPLDRTDKVAVDDRRELRTVLRGMERGARALLLSGPNSNADFVDAMSSRRRAPALAGDDNTAADQASQGIAGARRQGRVVTRGSTFENSANLAGPFLEAICKRYEGTRLGRQELNAALLIRSRSRWPPSRAELTHCTQTHRSLRFERSALTSTRSAQSREQRGSGGYAMSCGR